MEKLIDIEKQTNNKYLNLYKYTYNKNNKIIEYFVASRRDKNALECLTKSTDAVRAVPYIIKDNKIYVVVIKEFRHTINGFAYGTPAGMIDKGETSKEAVIRELREEIGAEVLDCKKVVSSSYSTCGLTDETIECFYCQVDLKYNQQLEETETIEYKIIDLDEIPSFVDSHKTCLQSALILKMFYYEMKLKEKGV